MRSRLALDSTRGFRFPLAAVLILVVSSLALQASEVPALDRSLRVSLSDLMPRIEASLPATWRVAEIGVEEKPIGWSGDPSGLYVMVEDTKTRFFHPNGFHYYSFYRIWLMPAGWEGVMRRTPYVSDSVPAFLLGATDDCVAFYHTAGGNVWETGLESFCSALSLDRVCHSDVTRRIVDLEIDVREVGQAQQSLLDVPLLVARRDDHRQRWFPGLADDGPQHHDSGQAQPADEGEGGEQ